MSFSTGDISNLRERTGAGIVDCKKALQESDGDVDKAVELLRQKGIASAAKKTGKVAAEGAVIAKTNADFSKGVIVELNSQTDFVAKNEKFQTLLNEIVEIALSNNINTIDDLKVAKTKTGETIESLVALKTAEIGEKLDLRRVSVYTAGADESIAQYTHPIGSKVAVLVKLKGKNEQVGKDVSMHIAASVPAPDFLDRDQIPTETLENEKRIEAGKADLANKPAEIVDKIVTGRVEKALMEKVLLEQPYIKNPGQKVKEYLAENKVNVLQFVRFNLGEGVEKAESNFADEVAAQMRG
jgi:elongation factor Ts